MKEVVARNAIVVYSVLVMVFNTLVTIFLPIVSKTTDMSTYSVELTTDIGATNTSKVIKYEVVSIEKSYIEMDLQIEYYRV